MRKFLEYASVILILTAAILGMIAVSAHKKPEPMVELYFDDYKNLPEYSNGGIRFSFLIHNMEGKESEYNVEVFVRNNGKEIVMDSFSTTLKSDEKKSFFENFEIEELNKAMVGVRIVNKNRTIYFWTNHAEGILQYENIGVGVLDCLPTNKAKETNRITISSKSDYAEGWAMMKFYVDGREVKGIEATSDGYRNYVINHHLGKGIHTIDIIFNNDLYDAEKQQDRNLYIDFVKIGMTTITPANMIYNKGKDKNAVDCQNTEKEGAMYGDGAMRFKVDVQ